VNSKRVTEFNQLLKHKDVLAYLNEQDFKGPTQVQQDAISLLSGDGNYTVQAKTGSGKTLAFLLPVFQKLKIAEEKNKSKDGVKASPKALIIAPTRELALQIFSVAKEISHFAKLRVRKLVGGDKGKSLISLFQSEIDILIATPDRALRAFEKGELSRKQLSLFVLDEADQLLEKSFEKTMAGLVLNVRNDRMQVYLVSASRPKYYDTIVKNVLPHKVEIYNSFLEEQDKFFYVSDFLQKQGKSNGVIFTSDKARAKELFQKLSDKGAKKLFLLHKDITKQERSKTVESFRDSGGIMVATDVFARGIDIPHLQWVLNFDLPPEADYYLHRSGRVGRAGRKGYVFNFVTKADNRRQARINEVLSKQGREDLKITKHRPKPKNKAKGKSSGKRRR
jgi:superfamily II DNA/RNA helicase